MIAEAWLEILESGDRHKLWDCARILADVEKAEQILRDKGYGVAWTPLLEQIEEVADMNAAPELTEWS